MRRLIYKLFGLGGVIWRLEQLECEASENMRQREALLTRVKLLEQENGISIWRTDDRRGGWQ